MSKYTPEQLERFKQYAKDGDWAFHPISLVGAEVPTCPSKEWLAMEEFHREYNRD